MVEFCQWVLVFCLATKLIAMVYADFNGFEARVARGFGGFCGSLVVFALTLAVWYGAGGFSTIVDSPTVCPCGPDCTCPAGSCCKAK